MDSTIVEVLAEMVKSGGTAAVWAILIWQGANVLIVALHVSLTGYVVCKIINFIKWVVQLDYQNKEDEE